MKRKMIPSKPVREKCLLSLKKFFWISVCRMKRGGGVPYRWCCHRSSEFSLERIRGGILFFRTVIYPKTGFGKYPSQRISSLRSWIIHDRSSRLWAFVNKHLPGNQFYEFFKFMNCQFYISKFAWIYFFSFQFDNE